MISDIVGINPSERDRCSSLYFVSGAFYVALMARIKRIDKKYMYIFTGLCMVS